MKMALPRCLPQWQEQQHYFNCPYQLVCLPVAQRTGLAGGDLPASSDKYTTQALKSGGIWLWGEKLLKNSGTPKWMVKIMENPIKMDDLGVPLFLKNWIRSQGQLLFFEVRIGDILVFATDGFFDNVSGWQASGKSSNFYCWSHV